MDRPCYVTLYQSRRALIRVRRPSEAVGQGFDGLGGPSYVLSECAILDRERYTFIDWLALEPGVRHQDPGGRESDCSRTVA